MPGQDNPGLDCARDVRAAVLPRGCGTSGGLVTRVRRRYIERTKLQLLSTRSVSDGVVFFQAPKLAFAFFFATGRLLRYDNLYLKMVTMPREDTAPLIPLRTHWRLDSAFCTSPKRTTRDRRSGRPGQLLPQKPAGPDLRKLPPQVPPRK